MTAPVAVGRSPLDDLKSALSSGGLDDVAQAAGEKLLARLTSAVRVVLLGLPQSGKSTILNMLAGQVVLPDGVSLPTTQLVWGDVAKTTYTMPDASLEVFSGIELDAASALQPALIRLEVPLAQLKKVSLLEVVAGTAFADQKRAMQWASKRADIALWCSTDFNDDEAELWSMMPEALLGHGFLVLTKADLLTAAGALSERVDNLRDQAEEYFHSVIPLAGQQALASMQENSEKSAELFVTSGGQTLITSILREVRAGRRADFDNIDVFLHRYGIAPDDGKPVTPEQPSVDEGTRAEPLEHQDGSTSPSDGLLPSAAVTMPEADISVFVAALELVKSGLEEKVEDQEDQAVSEPTAEIPQVAEPEAVEEYKPAPPIVSVTADKNTRRQVLIYLKDQADKMLEIVGDDEAVSDAILIERCVQAADYVGDLVLNDAGDDPSLAGYEQRCQEASDLLVLMQLEADQASARDAVTVLFQLKREFEERSS